MKVMKHVWRNGTAPRCTAEVPEFVEKHVHEEYALTAGVKSLPVHRHSMHVEKPMILRKPPHTVHKVLKGSANMLHKNSTTRDKNSVHPYKHAAAIASSRTAEAADSTEDDQADRRPPLSSP